MRRAVLPVLFVLCAVFAVAQVRPPFSSVGGFGSVLFPGTGHAPSLPPGGISGRVAIPGQFGRPFGNGGYGGGGLIRHQGGHGRTAIIPYPVYYGGYYGGYDGQGGYYPPDNGGPPPGLNPNGAPAVVINQNFIPDHANPMVREYDQPGDPSGQPSSGMRLYQAPPTHPYADAQEQAQAAPASAPRRPVYDEQPTLYLIAFQDHSIVQALGYWMEGDTLHYVSAEHSLNQASINLIDRKLSQRLNDERGVEFKLPAGR